MSASASLKLFRPLDESVSESTSEPAPVIYSIAAFRRSAPGPSTASHPQSAIARARTIHANRVCRSCGRTTVVPLEHHNAVLNRNLMPVPGTASLAGFSCHSCGAEWSLGDAAVDR